MSPALLQRRDRALASFRTAAHRLSRHVSVRGYRPDLTSASQGDAALFGSIHSMDGKSSYGRTVPDTSSSVIKSRDRARRLSTSSSGYPFPLPCEPLPWIAVPGILAPESHARSTLKGWEVLASRRVKSFVSRASQDLDIGSAQTSSTVEHVARLVRDRLVVEFVVVG